jgi:hypothetical protein
MPLLTIESAKAYVLVHFNDRAAIASAEMIDDGGFVVVVKGVSEDCGEFVFDVWEDERADGSAYLYGEY